MLKRSLDSFGSSYSTASDEYFDVVTNTPLAAPIPRVRPKTSARVTKLSQHEADGGEFQEREGVAVEIFPILGEAAATIEPRNRAFDDPALG